MAMTYNTQSGNTQSGKDYGNTEQMRNKCAKGRGEVTRGYQRLPEVTAGHEGEARSEMTGRISAKETEHKKKYQVEE